MRHAATRTIRAGPDICRPFYVVFACLSDAVNVAQALYARSAQLVSVSAPYQPLGLSSITA